MKKVVKLTESDLIRIVNRVINEGLYEQTTTGQTVNQMLQGKEFPNLTKQEQGDTVFYSSLDGQKRKWYISFRPSNNWIQTSIASVNPQYFNLVETLFNSLSSFKDIGPSSGLNKNTDMVFGVKQTPVNKDEIIKIFDTLVTTYNRINPTAQN